MNKWICKFIEVFDINDYENKGLLQDGDSIFIYKDDFESGTFILDKNFLFSSTTITENTNFNGLDSDLPYEIIYKCKNAKFLHKLTEKEEHFIFDINTNNQSNLPNEASFINFLEKIDISITTQGLPKVEDNITFVIGQPNTGKSYKFEKENIFPDIDKRLYNYKKIPVSGGIGNEYKGLQNTDLAITYDPIKKQIKFGEFLQVLMSAIVNPHTPHVVFLDDFHNQDISSLLSEYTPLFKSQQKRKIKTLTNRDIFKSEFSSCDNFIKGWNSFIEAHCDIDRDSKEIPVVPITNRVSGESINLVFPDNFYLLGAANFNENTLNVFADWEDRANISYEEPISSFKESQFYINNHSDTFLTCCVSLNEKLKEILKSNLIFDFEKYCFGLWKIVTSDKTIISDDQKVKAVKFFFGMIKNALKFNNKNSEINKIGWDLMCSIKTDPWIAANVSSIANLAVDEKNYELLHEYRIYEDDI